jgi:hypothetical protein
VTLGALGTLRGGGESSQNPKQKWAREAWLGVTVAQWPPPVL